MKMQCKVSLFLLLFSKIVQTPFTLNNADSGKSILTSRENPSNYLSLKYIISGGASIKDSINIYKKEFTQSNLNYKLQINKPFSMSSSDSLLNYENIYNFALMSYNAYTIPNNSDWYSLPYNISNDISIDPNTIKGYIFSDTFNKIHVIAIKGTSINWFNTNLNVKYDKFNDNLFLSCCYYKQSSIFTGDYSCNINYTETHICSKECYTMSRNFDFNYLNIMDQIGFNLEKLLDFNNHEIYFTGHSLGGLLATYMGLKYNKLTIAFEAPGTKHYFDLINIDQSNFKNIYHFGHNADTIFMGKCDGKLSLCYIGGYIIRTKCQVGYTCIYDSINKLNISESIFTHRMNYVIDKIIPEWNNDFPECKIIEDCQDCEQWSFI